MTSIVASDDGSTHSPPMKNDSGCRTGHASVVGIALLRWVWRQHVMLHHGKTKRSAMSERDDRRPTEAPGAGIEDRIEAMLSRMTLRENLAQLGGAWITELVDGEAFAPHRARRKLADGIGTVTRIGATTGLRPAARARLVNDVQRFLVEQTASGVPAIIHEESTAGYCARDA